MKPLVTLYHFVHPLWFDRLGHFEKAENLRHFVNYAKTVFRCALTHVAVSVSVCRAVQSYTAPASIVIFAAMLQGAAELALAFLCQRVCRLLHSSHVNFTHASVTNTVRCKTKNAARAHRRSCCLIM